MNEEFVIGLGQQAIWTILKLSAPALIFALVVGIIVSVLQAVTQIQEMTLALVPKIIAVIAALMIFGPWMIKVLTAFTMQLYTNLPNYIR
ncbi:MAG: flagellar biosynthesis protein FliQ [Firmicutes bacterium]|nr:flagellar biosynthesis protein FliQ [Bacillota bacterium]